MRNISKRKTLSEKLKEEIDFLTNQKRYLMLLKKCMKLTYGP